ncbi:hypothetical protein [Orientia tsutsugamushi]|nr:hypothetical protein [Orientia tsutsugamushi]
MPLFIYFFFYTLFILAYYVPISYVRAILIALNKYRRIYSYFLPTL